MRAAVVIEDMIEAIIKNEPVPIHQVGEVVCFERRKPADGNVANITSLEQLFDYIRMLDAEGYPKAFLETEHFRLEFQRASFRYDHVISDVRITRKREKHG